MNIILFSPAEVQLPLPRSDARARHILTVLRRRVGESCDVGLINGPRGKATIAAVADDHLRLTFSWGEPPAPLPPLHLIVGLPRPQTARDLLRETTALGISRITLVRTARGEPSYAQSSLWQNDEWHEQLRAGAAQAFCTQLPEVRHGVALEEALAALAPDTQRVALDNYEASVGLADLPASSLPAVTLAVGAERGWDATERELLRRLGFTLAHLGPRVLRTETATIAAITLLKARRGWL